MSDTIEIVGLRVHGHHGVYAAEKDVGQVFQIDVVLDADLATAAVTDDLADTVDYGSLAARIAEEVRVTQFDLIERLAGHLLDVILLDPRVMAAEVRIAKPEAPMDVDVDHVAVRLRRAREATDGLERP